MMGMEGGWNNYSFPLQNGLSRLEQTSVRTLCRRETGDGENLIETLESMDNSLGCDAGQQTKLSLANQFPEDIIRDILLHLPVKSVVRFRCVCKLWYSLLTSPNFFDEHLQLSCRKFYLIKVDELIKPEARLIRSTIGFPKLECKFALAPDDNLDEVVNVDHPIPQMSSKFCMGNGQLILDIEVIGSIDGLFCISFNGGTCIMMWNPATRQSYQVPSPGACVSGLWSFSLGLGRYQKNGYKVVRVVYGSSNQFPHSIVKAQVYDMNSNLWLETADPPKLHFDDFRCSTIANGVPYWKSDYDLLAFDCSDVVTWFDPLHETFGTMKRPGFGIEEGHCVWRLGVIREALVMFVQKLNGGIDVWMVDEPRGDVPVWTRQFCIEGVPRVYSCIDWLQDGELLFDGYENTELCLYDYLRDETKIVPWIGSRLDAPDEIFPYMESLISPRPSC